MKFIVVATYENGDQRYYGTFESNEKAKEAMNRINSLDYQRNQAKAVMIGKLKDVNQQLTSMGFDEHIEEFIDDAISAIEQNGSLYPIKSCSQYLLINEDGSVNKD